MSDSQQSLLEKLASTHRGPGVYLMKDEKGTIIYVGKAANLKNRLSSYFTKSHPLDPKTGLLVTKITTFETIVTASEKEALILESTLIKHHRPRYNVILKDDKRYPALRMDMKEEYPYPRIVRKIKNDGALYFGPYAAAGDVKKTLKILNKTFKLCKCVSDGCKKRTRPCLNFQMGLCLAPCYYPVSKDLYNEIVNEVKMFLNGKTHDLIDKIKHDMSAAADRQEYEAAAQLRDKVFAIEHTVEKQLAVTADFMDRDVIGIARNPMFTVVVVMIIRDGFMKGLHHFSLKDKLSMNTEIIGAFIKQHYEKNGYIPQEILIPVDLEDGAVYEEWLTGLRQSKVRIISPKRGDKLTLLGTAEENARARLKLLTDETASGQELLSRLQRCLKLVRFPRRIECFDISGMGGKELVAGMVVFEEGKPGKSAYRRFIIKTVQIQDDYASMREVLERRFKKDNRSGEFPDLLMVDGGKGQLSITMSVLKSLQIDAAFDIIAIAKKDETKNEPQDKIYKPGRVNPVNFGKEGELLMFLQRIRDETHRYAISYFRKKKSKNALHSELDAVPGIGPKRKRILLKHFLSIKKMRQAPVEELAAIPGMTKATAEAVFNALSELGLST